MTGDVPLRLNLSELAAAEVFRNLEHDLRLDGNLPEVSGFPIPIS